MKNNIQTTTINKNRFLVIVAFIVMACVSRLFPHPFNFTPIAAMALFAGAYFKKPLWAFGIPLLALLASDVLLHATYLLGWREYGGFYATMPIVYACFAAVVGLGWLINKQISVLKVVGATLAGSVLFYLVTNFAVWAFSSMYPLTFSGLLTCYEAAIPFFRSTLLGNFVYVGILFGSFELLQKRFPSLQYTWAS